MIPRQLKENFNNFSLDDCPRGNQGYQRVLLQLFGFTGHGKSSLINSCLYVLDDDGEFIEHAEAKDISGGLTMIRKDYQLTNNITIVDNRGFSTMDYFQTAEIYAQLGNFMPLNRVEWKNNYNDMMELVEESEMDPNYTDFIVPVFVFSVKAGLAEEKMPEVKIFMDNCREMTGIVPIVVLTNKTSGNYFMTDRQFKDMGAETVISVENYTKEKNIKTLGNSTEFLMFIDSAIKEVQLHMQQIRDPIAERVDRKTFVLKYIHDAEETKAKAELQRQQDRLERKRRDTKRREREVREEMEEMEREQRKKKRKRPWWKFW